MAPRTFSVAERERLAARGEAMPDGSFPTPDRDALRRAVESYGRAKPSERGAVRRYLVRRAIELDATDELPKGWHLHANEKD